WADVRDYERSDSAFVVVHTQQDKTDDFKIADMNTGSLSGTLSGDAQEVSPDGKHVLIRFKATGGDKFDLRDVEWGGQLSAPATYPSNAASTRPSNGAFTRNGLFIDQESYRVYDLIERR